MPLSKIQTTNNQVVPNLGRRNMVINGAMEVAQRGTNIDDIATDGQKNLDMFVTRDYGGNGTYDFDQSGNLPNSTFSNSLKLTCKSASTNTGSYGYALEHRIEGYRMRQLRLGRSTAQPITVSFHVKSSVAGTYSTGLRTTGGETSHVTEFTLSANTWKYVTYTAPALTTSLSSLDEGTGLGLIVDIVGLGKQTSKATTTFNAWQSGNYVFSNNQVAWMDNVNATLNVTGLQVEAGSSATKFEHRSFGEELLLCKRYYTQIVGGSDAFVFPGKGQGTASVDGIIPLAVPLRASPTMNSISSRFFTDSGFSSTTVTPTANQFQANNDVLAINIGSYSGGASFTNNEAGVWGVQAGTLTISAEL